MAQLDEPSVEAEKIPSTGAIGGDNQVGNSSVAIASSAATAVDPLTDALAALDRRDYATAQRLFEACGRKDAAGAIEDAWAALDRKDYATAQRLFEALGRKDAAAAQVKGSARATLAPPEPTASGPGSMVVSDSRAQQKLVPSPVEVIPFVDAAYRRTLPQAERAKARGLKLLLVGTGLVFFATCAASAFYGLPLNWTFATTKSRAVAGLASAVDVLKRPVEAITGLSRREGERSAMGGLHPAMQTPVAPPGASRPQEPAYGSAAAQLYSKGDAAGLAALAKAARDPDERLALEWASLRSDAHLSVAALAAFAEAHPGWPDGGWIRLRREAQLLVNSEAPAKVAAYFASEPPQSSAGMIAAARAANATGRSDEGVTIVRALWRDGDFDFSAETLILREFGAALTRADHKYRADRLLYAESFAAALRAAALAGPDISALARARIAAARGPLTPALAMAVPPPLRNDPGLLFARIRDARRSNRAYEAAVLLALAPRDRAALVNPDRWWSERRKVAGELLDLDEPRLAFELCDNMVRPDDSADQVDADFYAGWIALRFLGNARAAAQRFERAAQVAQTPISIARAAYWRGRAAEALGDSNDAKVHYETAASEPIAYYGQLAAQRLGEKRLALRAPIAAAEGDRRDEAVRAAEALYADGLDELASGLGFDAARQWQDESQIAAMADVIKRFGDAATEVVFGKIATHRGYDFDAMTFPISGVPAFLPLPHSADLASIYAVARQESEFLWQASSGAGAKGLMQLLPSTAASTARRAGVAFDYARLLVDPAFNTQLGAAFLGQVLEDEGGSYALALAAYNAGGGRVVQWIAAHGDPRTGGADLVDWIERIPFDETRDYVERVSENLGVYRQRLADEPPTPAPMSPLLARE
jgi:soluble lytic murein transglycosylase